MYTQTGWMCPEPGQVRLNGKEKMTLVSCGRFRLPRRQMAETVRPNGRQDWQIIYVKSGAGDYWTDGECRHVTEGHIILYRPGEPQRYRNELADQPDIYWVHFAGTEVDSELERLGFSQGHIFYVGSSREYDCLFEQIIAELQVKQCHFQELTEAYLRQLLSLFARHRAVQTGAAVRRTAEVEAAVRWFHQNFSQPFCVSEYAKSCGMSPRWFTQQFTRQMGVSPQQYLTGVRMEKACELLALPEPVSGVSELLGYQNPLYFSRVFRKHMGMCPTEYRKKYCSSPQQPFVV